MHNIRDALHGIGSLRMRHTWSQGGGGGVRTPSVTRVSLFMVQFLYMKYSIDVKYFVYIKY